MMSKRFHAPSNCFVKILIITLSLIAIDTTSVKAEENQNSYFYFSPGIRFGYVFGGGFNFTTEVTLGRTGGWKNYFAHTSIALGCEFLDKGAELKLTGFYTSLQGGITVIGASGGLFYYPDKGRLRIGGRFAGYAGVGFASVSVDYLLIPTRSNAIGSIGLWLKDPNVSGDFDLNPFPKYLD